MYLNYLELGNYGYASSSKRAMTDWSSDSSDDTNIFWDFLAQAFFCSSVGRQHVSIVVWVLEQMSISGQLWWATLQEAGWNSKTHRPQKLWPGVPNAFLVCLMHAETSNLGGVRLPTLWFWTVLGFIVKLATHFGALPCSLFVPPGSTSFSIGLLAMAPLLVSHTSATWTMWS